MILHVVFNQLFLGFPCIVAGSVPALPFHKILDAASLNPLVENALDLIQLLSERRLSKEMRKGYEEEAFRSFLEN